MSHDRMPIYVAAGILVGNTLVHGMQGNYGKGAIIGLMAAILVLCIYYAAYYIATGRFR